MKHKIGFNRLGRKASHRKALHRNMTTSLFRHERIKTTKAKALAIRRTAEKMITRSKIDSVHNRRIIAKDINDKEIVAKLFTDIGPRYKERPGGYTRILKLGFRQGDAAEIVLLELVETEGGEKKNKKKKAAKPARSEKTVSKGEQKTETVTEEKAESKRKKAAPKKVEQPAKGEEVKAGEASTEENAESAPEVKADEVAAGDASAEQEAPAEEDVKETGVKVEQKIEEEEKKEEPTEEKTEE
ncbi:MAG: 50S ribosomal protein L17 [Spirochaetota bacterium]|nr:50S ribosomal protein L17 [Spirochaetota bacterium]